MSGRPSILVGDGIDARTRAGLERHFDCFDLVGADIQGLPQDRAASIGGVAIGGWIDLPRAATDRLPALAMVSCLGVGYDAIDVAHMSERGVIVTHTPGVLDDEVANTTIALVLAVTRRIVAYDRHVREGRWAKEGNPPFTRGLAGKTIGLLGLGRIGLTIARKLEIFGSRIAYHTRRPRADVSYTHYADPVALARDCDVLINILPGGDATRHLIGRTVLDALGPDGTLVNVGRGSTVDEAELVAALAQGRLGAAGLDVFEAEPDVPQALMAMDNVVLLPHVGSATIETRGAMGQLVVDNLVAWLGGDAALTPVPECGHLQR